MFSELLRDIACVNEVDIWGNLDKEDSPYALSWRMPAESIERPICNAFTRAFETIYQSDKVLYVGSLRQENSAFENVKVLDLYDGSDGVDYRFDIADREQMAQIEDETFDLVICHSVLEHVPKFWIAAEQMQRILKPEGHIFVQVPFVWPYHTTDALENETERFCGMDYWRVTHEGMVVLFDQCNPLAVWYLRGSPECGDPPGCGWGVSFVGEKKKEI